MPSPLRSGRFGQFARLAATVVALGSIARVASAEEPKKETGYHFVGIYRVDTGKPYTFLEDHAIELDPIASKDAFEARKKAFRSAHPGETHLLDTRRAALVYQYKTYATGYKDKFTMEYGVVYGSDLDQAGEALAKRVQERRASFLTDPKIIFSWSGGGRYGFREQVERKYNSVVIKYTVAGSSSGKTVVIAQGSNTHPELTAVVRLPSASDPSVSEEIRLRPGERFTQRIGVLAGFPVQVKLIETSSESVDVEKVIFQWVKDKMTVKDGKLRSDVTYTTLGVRG